MARLVSAHSGKTKIDWATSAASRLPRPGKPLSATASAKLRQESQGAG